MTADPVASDDREVPDELATQMPHFADASNRLRRHGLARPVRRAAGSEGSWNPGILPPWPTVARKFSPAVRQWYCLGFGTQERVPAAAPDEDGRLRRFDGDRIAGNEVYRGSSPHT